MIASLVIASPVGAKQSHKKIAIVSDRRKLGNPPLRAQRGNLTSKKVEIAQPVPSKAKESSGLLAMTYNHATFRQSLILILR